MTARSQAAVTLALLLALSAGACTAPAPEAGQAATGATGAEPADACRQIATLHVQAQREGFALNFPEAESRLRAIVVAYGERGDPSPCPGTASLAVAHAELGLAISSQRRFRLAEASFADARSALAAMPAVSEADRSRRQLDEGRVRGLEAQHALNRRDFAAARDGSRAALALLGGAGPTQQVEFGELIELDPDERSRRVGSLSSLFTQSVALRSTGQAEAARSAGVEAAAVASALPGATGALRARVLTERALGEFDAGRPDGALALAREAADLLETELPGTPLAGRARLVEGAILARLGREREAFAAFDRAFATYAETPAALQYETIWPFIRLSLEARDAGRLAPEAAAAGIFRAAQLVRSASAAGDIAQSAALAATGTGEAASAVRAWRAAQEEVRLLTSALSRRDVPGFEREALNRRLVRAAETEAAARARRDRLAPGYRRAIEAPTTLAELQRALRPGEALLQVLVGAPRSTLILVEPTRVQVATSVMDGEFAAVATQLLRAPTEADARGRYPGYPAGVAHQVHDLLLGPFAAAVRGQQKVFVSATGAIQGLPFEMLVTEDPAAQSGRLARGDYSGVAWLGAATRFSYLPSPRNLVDLRGAAGQSAASQRLIGFGDFRPGRDFSVGIDARRRASCAPEIALLRQLAPLPGTATELDRIEAALGEVRTLTGAAFSEDAVKALSGEGQLRDFRIVHMATHGVLWSTADCFEPALTATPLPGSAEDGLIESSEVRGLDLDAQLVVLSACQSTDPTVADAGENLSGLARAFFTSGARSVIASHWNVSDEQTAALMAAFYGQIAGAPVTPFSTALGQAQAALRGNPATSHPAFWAPFVVLGDGTLALGPT